MMYSPQILILTSEQSFCCQSEICRDLPSFIKQTLDIQQVHISTRFDESLHCFSNPDIVLFRLPPEHTLQNFIEHLRKTWRQSAFIALLCGGLDTEATRNACCLAELDEFLSCPFQLHELAIRIRRQLQKRGSDSAPPNIEPSIKKRFVGESHVLRTAIAKIPLFASSDATILISGETGTGKDLYARSIHYHSIRRAKPFIPVNCGALPEQLFENEMFGHTKGAYTDAHGEQNGLLQEAEGGTIFLDEIDALSPAAQIKLLRFVQDREYRPLGSPKIRTADVRILAATNANLLEKIHLKAFREDLYYRLNILSVPLPPLRDHLEDIPLLADHFVSYYASQNGMSVPRLSPQALQKLLAYHWPGNIREFQTIIQRAVIVSSSHVLEADVFDLPANASKIETSIGAWSQAKGRAIEQFERAFLTNLLSTHHGNVSQAARAAGKERRSFQRLLRKYGLDRSKFLAHVK